MTTPESVSAATLPPPPPTEAISSDASEEELPPVSPPVSKSDRLLLYRKIENTVHKRVGLIQSLPDTRRKGFFSSRKPKQDENDKSWVKECGCRGRQMYYFQKGLLPIVASCLLLSLEDLMEQDAVPEAEQEDSIEALLECISLLLANIVMLSKGNYDSRLRSVVKEVCIELLLKQQQKEGVHPPDPSQSRSIYLLEKASVPKGAAKQQVDEEEAQDVGRSVLVPSMSALEHATKCFEEIERSIAAGILQAMLDQSQEGKAQIQQKGRRTKARQILVRTLQISSVGLVVGGIFALTGGLAAPGLVAAISAFGIGTSSAAFATLTGLHAMMTLFGVTGGGMAAYKMKKRTATVTEWRIRKEPQGKQENIIVRGLHATVCISGWLVDRCDFQRPWGVMATDPKMKDKHEILQRYFAVHGPDKIKFAKALLKANHKREGGLWEALEQKYGRDPDHLVPFDRRTETRMLSEAKQIAIMDVLALQVLPEDCAKQLDTFHSNNTMLIKMEEMNAEILGDELAEMEVATNELDRRASDEEVLAKMEAMNSEVEASGSVRHLESEDDKSAKETEVDGSDEEKKTAESAGDEKGEHEAMTREESSDDDNEEDNKDNNDDEEEAANSMASKDAGEMLEELDAKERPTNVDEKAVKNEEHDVIVWDWEASFGGDMYTLTWETELLYKLCKVVNLLSAEIGTQITKQVAQQALLGATVAIPSALMTASNVIDDPYQMISFRSDYSGVELAKCLLESGEHRPVTLAGYSFGARVIFSCMLELARHQILWEEQQKEKRKKSVEAQAEETGKEANKSRWRLKKRSNNTGAAEMDYKREPASIVEDVVLIGMPRLLEPKEWITCREVVGGRLVNCYNKNDWFLSYLFQIRCWAGVSRWMNGTHPVQDVIGVENFDVTDAVSTHGRYPLVVPQILHQVGLGQPRGTAEAMDT